MFLDLLFPNSCLGCECIIDGKEIICNLCRDKIHFTHFNFYEHHILKQKCQMLFPIENAFALLYYEKNQLSQKIIHQLKYKQQEKVGRILADWTTEFLHLDKETPDLITNIPLHPKKLKQRGYNQLHLFTEILSKFYQIPYDHNILKRDIYTQAQAQKDKAHRQEHSNVFSINKKISQRHILLIDDVITTGNTLSSAAWELSNQGHKVSVLLMAIDI